jgi:hypothetical protein
LSLQPLLPGTRQSVPDLEERVAYQRAFEAVVWAMPASVTHRFREGLYEVPALRTTSFSPFQGLCLPPANF